MMKVRGLMLTLILGLVLIGATACKSGNGLPTQQFTPQPTQPAIVKPYVSYVPSGWYLSDDDEPYGLLEYTDAVNGDFVQIWYDEVPYSLAGKENDGNALIAQAVAEAIFTPTDTGMMTVNGKLAGYAEAYDYTYGWWETEVVFVNGDTYVDIYALYKDINIDNAADLIESIY